MSLNKQQHTLISLVLPLLFIITITLTLPQRISSRSLLPIVSDGGDRTRSLNAAGQVGIFESSNSSSSCDQTYGFLPCTRTWIGNLFMIIVYGYLMFLSATYLSAGSELLLQILGPGIIGGLFLPFLGALPDAMLILVSGLSGSKTSAQSQVSVGMGLLAGSTVMLITVIWGSCVVVGKCDICDSHPVALDGEDTKGFNLLRSGVSTDIWTCYAARIMVASLLPYIVVQIPQLLGSSSDKHLAVLVALIIAQAGLITYCLYQAFQPWIQQRKLKYVQHRHVMSGVLRHFRQHTLGRFLDDEGQPDIEVVQKLFHSLDENKDGFLSASEMKALIIGIRFSEIDFDMDDVMARIMRDFDTSQDDQIDITEFNLGITKWLLEARRAGASSCDPRPQTSKFLGNFHLHTTLEHALLAPGDQQGEEENREAGGDIDNPRGTTIQAVLLLLLGTIMAAVFADPLVDVVDYFSDATGIPTFFISFVVLPLVTNTSEAVSAVIFASRKRIKTASLTFSELYGAVTMNNLLCLSVFLALVYVRGLTWDFSSEILVILVVCVVMGGFASFRTTFPLWTLFLACFLYPFSLALVYVLDYVLGWS